MSTLVFNIQTSMKKKGVKKVQKIHNMNTQHKTKANAMKNKITCNEVADLKRKSDLTQTDQCLWIK